MRAGDFTRIPGRALVLWLACSTAISAQDAGRGTPPPQPQDPLSVIDWLGTKPSPAVQRQRPPAAPHRPEPAIAKGALPPSVTVSPLGDGGPREIGLVPASVTGLPAGLWEGSAGDKLIHRLDDLPDPQLPAAQALLYTLLLADARAPRGGVAEGDALALARVRKLMTLGALDPAMSLIEQAGVATSVDHFELWMQISLLTGTEDRPCATLQDNPHLTRDYALRIFCTARTGDWEDAALIFGSVQALGLIDADKIDLMDRFLNPEAYEGLAPLRAPRGTDPLSFRVFEAIGEPLPTRSLPRAFAVADLRDVSGWKAQIEAAERLTRAGALPDNYLLGLYTDRRPAASGGIWDRVARFQRFETAIDQGSDAAISQTLPDVWDAMKEAQIEVTFATLFANRLGGFDLTGRAADLAEKIALLSPDYETAATRMTLSEYPLAVAVARGSTPPLRPEEPVPGAIFDAFRDAPPREDLLAQTREGRLGESIVALISLLGNGASGDTVALRDALATLRALGLEDTARRAALQILLLER